PCREFWADVRSGGAELRQRWGDVGPPEEAIAGDDPFGLLRDGDTPALRLWGRPGRENVRLLDALTVYNFEERFRDPLDDGSSLLRALQHDILVRRPDTTAPGAGRRAERDERRGERHDSDGTIRVL